MAFGACGFAYYERVGDAAEYAAMGEFLWLSAALRAGVGVESAADATVLYADGFSAGEVRFFDADGGAGVWEFVAAVEFV